MQRTFNRIPIFWTSYKNVRTTIVTIEKHQLCKSLSLLPFFTAVSIKQKHLMESHRNIPDIKTMTKPDKVPTNNANSSQNSEDFFTKRTADINNIRPLNKRVFSQSAASLVKYSVSARFILIEIIQNKTNKINEKIWSTNSGLRYKTESNKLLRWFSRFSVWNNSVNPMRKRIMPINENNLASLNKWK